MAGARRRWDGWGDPEVSPALPPRVAAALDSLVGPGTPPTDATLPTVLAGLPPSGLPATTGLSTEPEDRLRHARGQDLPDWVALRSGRIGRVPDAVARPADAPAVRALLDEAAAHGWRLIPYGGGTNVVGGLTVPEDGVPTISVDLGATAGLRHLDPTSGLATFGAGTLGPDVEAALALSGRTLGHFPQSFERSTLGGWVVTRSAGQESMGAGRIEALFAGGHLEAPVGSLDLPPVPASAAGPDLRELVLGSEGRLGILTDVVVRTSHRPDRAIVRAYSLPDWDRAMTAGRTLAASGLPLSMVRVSTPAETATTLAMVPDRGPRRILRSYLGWRGQGGDACFVLVGIQGPAAVVRAVEGEVARLVKAQRGIGVPGLGPTWVRERFRGPYLRDALWAAGYAVDTMETAIDWARLPALATALGSRLRHGLEAEGEGVHAFSHLSHLYPSGSSLYVTYVFRHGRDPDQTLERWRRLKTLASQAVVEHGGTISHQHGVGRVHAPYLPAEKGALGMTTLRTLVETYDPDGRLQRGVLLGDDPAGSRP